MSKLELGDNNAAQAGLQNFKFLAPDLTLALVANSRLYGRDFNQLGTRHRPTAGTHGGQLSGNRNIFTLEVP